MIETTENEALENENVSIAKRGQRAAQKQKNYVKFKSGKSEISASNPKMIETLRKMGYKETT